MPPPPVVLVRWRDSQTGYPGWHAAKDAQPNAQGAWDNPLYAAGFLVVDAAEYIVVASAWNPAAGDPEVTGTMMIPRSEVVAIHRLRKG